MLVLEFKAKGHNYQYKAIDEAIRTAQFIRNKCLRLWMDEPGKNKYDLNKYCAVLAKEFPFAKELNSSARQSSAERTWAAISRFYDNCKKQIPGKKADATPRRRKAHLVAHQAGFPKFKKFSRSVEYKKSGWKLSPDTKWIKFTDKKGIGKLKLKGTWELWRYDQKLIKRVRLVRRADGYYVQFCVSVDVKETIEPSRKTIGLDVGLKEFYTDSDGNTQSNPRFYRQGEKRLKFYQKRVSRKKKGSSNRKRAINKLGRTHLKISRQREEHAKRLARCVIHSNDVVAYEDLRVRNLVKKRCDPAPPSGARERAPRHHCLAKSINDAGWYQFRKWIEYFGKKFGRVTIAVNPAYTSQNCSSCGEVVKKSLSTRTHVCSCGCELDRDHNAAINILERALGTAGHVGTWVIDPNASGDLSATVLDSGLSQQAES